MKCRYNKNITNYVYDEKCTCILLPLYKFISPLRVNSTPSPYQLLKFSLQNHDFFHPLFLFVWVVHVTTFIPDFRVTQLRFSKRISPGLIQRPIKCKNSVKMPETFCGTLRCNEQILLIHFILLVSSYTPLNHQKTSDVLLV